MYKIFFSFLLFLIPQFVFAYSPLSVYLTNDQTVATNTVYPILFDTVDFLDSSLYSYSNGTTTILVSGFYRFDAGLRCDNTSQCSLRIFVNNTQVFGAFSAYADLSYTPTADPDIEASAVLYLSEGDKIEAKATNATYTIIKGASNLRITYFQLTNISSPTQLVIDEAQNIFYGIIIFMFSMWFIVWYFRGKNM